MEDQGARVKSNESSPNHNDSAFEALIGYNLKRAYLIVQNDYRKAMDSTGLSARAFAAMSFVVTDPGITQADLARRLGIERSGLVAVVDGLENLGYLKRVPVPGDRRVQALQPTETGNSAYDDALARAQAHEAALLEMLTPAETKTLLTLLQKIRTTGDLE
jgi:DNA-binding MarR family transcriptional regulator